MTSSDDDFRGSYQGVTGEPLLCAVREVTFQLRRLPFTVTWRAAVRVPQSTALTFPVWGRAGFLEHFRTEFQYPRQGIQFTAPDDFPHAAAPGH
jgi:hypothetical protein